MLLLNDKLSSTEKFGRVVTADVTVPKTENIGFAVITSVIISDMEKVIPRVTTDMTLPSKKIVDPTTGIAESGGKIFSIRKLSRKYSLIKYLFR